MLERQTVFELTPTKLQTIRSILALWSKQSVQPLGYHVLGIDAISYWIENGALPGTTDPDIMRPKDALFFVPIASAFPKKINQLS